MAQKTDIQFFQNPNAAEIKRRRAMAEMLSESVPQPNPTRMAGNLVVPVSPFEALASGLSKGVQAYQNTKADAMETEFETARAKAYADAMAQFETNPQAAQAALMQIDPALGIQLANAMKNTEKTTPQIQNFEYLQSLPPDQRAAAQAIIAPKAPQVSVDPETGEVSFSAAPPKPMPASIIKQENEAIRDITKSKTAQDFVKQNIQNIDTGVLQLGPIKNLASWIKNNTGNSDLSSRAYSKLINDLESNRNAILLLAKGVQTEGDAQRAMDEIITSKNDPKVVRDALGRLDSILESAITANMVNIDTNRENFRQEPYDYQKLKTLNFNQDQESAKPIVSNDDKRQKLRALGYGEREIDQFLKSGGM